MDVDARALVADSSAGMTFTFAIFLAGSVLCCWSVLRCMGNERQRRMNELETRLYAESQSPPPPDVARVDAASKGH